MIKCYTETAVRSEPLYSPAVPNWRPPVIPVSSLLATPGNQVTSETAARSSCQALTTHETTHCLKTVQLCQRHLTTTSQKSLSKKEQMTTFQFDPDGPTQRVCGIMK